ncbi:hypothetical protein DIS24_g9856 [Lasiodiplodia hormozganensis]|uniref:Uncharacterized protein n=1 Tax=Lasiodiplodia hormozganensis TaxID=869390 RepID=A0AA40CHF3_9PEZI|nr:hypothetical protein DIS24_g9856 [Lasiodiplodia hormozganensis]
MNYREYTIPKEVEESDKRQREDPNYKRPRKLPPRIVFRSVVAKAQQEMAAAGGLPLQQNTRHALTRKDKSYTALRITRAKKVEFKSDGTEDNGVHAMAVNNDEPANAATSAMDIDSEGDTDTPTHRSRSHSRSSSVASSASSTDTIPLTIRATARTLAPTTPTPTRASLIAPSLSLPTTPPARMPTYDESDRLGRRFDSWTYTEAMATTSLIQHAFHELPYGAGGYGPPLALRMVDKFALVAEMLDAVYGIKKTGHAVKNWWERDGRELTGMGDEKKVRPEGVPEGVEPARVGRGIAAGKKKED